MPARSSPKLVHPAGDIVPERGQCRGTCHVPGLSLIPQPDKVCRSSVFPGSLAADCPLPARGRRRAHPEVPPAGHLMGLLVHLGHKLAAELWVSVFRVESRSGLIAQCRGGIQAGAVLSHD